MTTRDDLQQWVLDALKALGGSGKIVDVCKHIWQNHEAELKSAGDLFYTWQYDVRWAAQKLRDDGQLKRILKGSASPWEIA